MTRDVGYDERGNITTLGGLSFIYDMADQPRAVSSANRTGAAVSGGSYAYDGNLKRAKSVINGVIRYNVYDKEGRLAHIEQGADIATSIKTDYLHAAGKTLDRIKNTGDGDVFTYLHPDHLGSASAGTKEDGTIAFTEFHTPFGEALLNAAANDNQSDFMGHIRDKDIGMSYMQARYMDPNIGRFLSIDPMTFMSTGNPRVFNRYAYSFNPPINLVDPTGEIPLAPAAGACVGPQAVGCAVGVAAVVVVGCAVTPSCRAYIEDNLTTPINPIVFPGTLPDENTIPGSADDNNVYNDISKPKITPFPGESIGEFDERITNECRQACRDQVSEEAANGGDTIEPIGGQMTDKIGRCTNECRDAIWEEVDEEDFRE